MKATIWNGIMRAIRHGLAPVIVYLTAEGYITEEQGASGVNAILMLASIIFAVVWSWARTAFPAIRLLG